jgi:hypothetical protein
MVDRHITHKPASQYQDIFLDTGIFYHKKNLSHPLLTLNSLMDILCFHADLQPSNCSISTNAANPFFCVFIIYCYSITSTCGYLHFLQQSAHFVLEIPSTFSSSPGNCFIYTSRSKSWLHWPLGVVELSTGALKGKGMLEVGLSEIVVHLLWLKWL